MCMADLGEWQLMYRVGASVLQLDVCMVKFPSKS